MIEPISIAVRGQGLHGITDRITAVVSACGLKEGLCTLFIRHTSASLLTIAAHTELSSERVEYVCRKSMQIQSEGRKQLARQMNQTGAVTLRNLPGIHARPYSQLPFTQGRMGAMAADNVSGKSGKCSTSHRGY